MAAITFTAPTGTTGTGTADGSYSIPAGVATGGTAPVTVTKTVAPAFDANTAGAYVVTYTATDSATTPVTKTKSYTVTLSAAAGGGTGGGTGSIAAEFIAGSKLRDGTDVSGTAYETAVKAEAVDADVTTEAYQSAYFSEECMDPYEVANSR